MKFLLVKCKEDVIISRRRADGAPDHYFIKGKEYDMCLDERKNECFTLSDVEEMHFFGQKNNCYFDENFEVVTELQEEGFTANELRIHRLKKMEKEKHNHEE
ncbi:hypothetical protein [Bacillus cereus]|uniref:hypothetical protein n=2 Tax=Bacillus TaxID=1386 RepID=UPI00235FF2D3|nr:hypothetical protein [Bacillus cereus]MDD0821011.1 hypothetical protein [Bacillus cereus]